MTFRRLSVPAEMADQRIAESVLIIAPPFFMRLAVQGE
jgi:hypothetical protein